MCALLRFHRALRTEDEPEWKMCLMCGTNLQSAEPPTVEDGLPFAPDAPCERTCCGYLCAECSPMMPVCERCSDAHCPACWDDESSVCDGCSMRLSDHCCYVGFCERCEESFCDRCRCVDTCEECHRTACDGCVDTICCEDCGNHFCDDCDHAVHCDTCDCFVCKNCRPVCDVCGEGHCSCSIYHCDSCVRRCCQECLSLWGAHPISYLLVCGLA